MDVGDEQERKQKASKRRAVRGGSYQSAGETKEVYRRNAIPCSKLSTQHPQNATSQPKPAGCISQDTPAG